MSDGRRHVAVVQMLIEVEASGVWGAETTVKQVEDQAARETRQGFLNVLQHVEKPYSNPKILSCSVVEVKIQHEKRR